MKQLALLAALKQFQENVQKGDVVIVMAVGSFNTLVYDLKEIAENKLSNN